jgi:hypothetical protein
MTMSAKIRVLIGYALFMYGPWRLTCNPHTRFGSWCLSNGGSWAYRKEAADAELTGSNK